ncbi:MAG: hypothetical protein MUP17_06910 [candidate division Zixibacteria bacterium]|nr:hypothetical protein [candidate division Zixibacteria bacterium]
MPRRKPDYSNWEKDKLIARIQELEKRKKYGLVWDEEREPEKVVQQCKKQLPVLKEVKSKAIKNDPEKPTHILIEGDNYHALSVLNYTHEKSIDVIYIDPPFNTGARDWKYNNNYVDNNDLFRHSKWLCMMNHRLKIAKNLLTEEGVMITAIDDNEHATLKLLLEDLMPQYTHEVVVVNHHPQGSGGANVSATHEYGIVSVPKGKHLFVGEYIGERIEEWSLIKAGAGKDYYRVGRPKMFFAIHVDKKTGMAVDAGPELSIEDKYETDDTKEGFKRVYPIDSNGRERRWRYGRETMIKLIREGRIVGSKPSLSMKVIMPRKGSLKPIYSNWVDSKYNAGPHGTNLLKNILPDTNFPFPKSLYTVIDSIAGASRIKKNCIVLDFFAGSGTTAHAVLEINRLDNGNRQFILCTNNEGDICEKVCYPRVEKIIEGYTADSKTSTLLFDKKISLRGLSKTVDILEEIENVKNTHSDSFDKFEIKFEDNTIRVFGVTNKENIVQGYGGNLKYFKTDFVPAQPTDRNKAKLTKQSVEMLCLKESTFELVSETDTTKIFKSTEKYTGILFDEQKIPEFKEHIKDFDKPVRVYIFSLGDDDFIEEFEELHDKVKVCSIPAAILRVYKRIFK